MATMSDNLTAINNLWGSELTIYDQSVYGTQARQSYPLVYSSITRVEGESSRTTRGTYTAMLLVSVAGNSNPGSTARTYLEGFLTAIRPVGNILDGSVSVEEVTIQGAYGFRLEVPFLVQR